MHLSTEQKKYFARAENIINTLKDNQFEAYFVGGCVRDVLLNQAPKDLDITTNAHPHQVENLFPKTLKVGAHFGVMVVMLQGEPFEVATFRNDGAYIDGRRPNSVEFSTAKEDVLRRDFTINGLLYDYHQNQIIDHVNGLEDLKQKCLKAIGDPLKRFEEDKLRMLRALRFASTKKFQIEQNTYHAILTMANQINIVSKERITEELSKMITASNFDDALSLLHDSNIFKQIFQEYNHIDISLLLKQSQWMKTAKWENALYSFFLHSDLIPLDNQAVTKRQKAIKTFFSQLTLSNQIIKNLLQIDLDIQNLMKYSSLTKAQKAILYLQPTFNDAFLIWQTYQKALGLNQNICQQIHLEAQTWLKNSPFTEVPEALLNGNALMDLGIPKGIILKEIKEKLIEEQLLQNIKNQEEAIIFVKKNYLSKGMRDK